MPVFTVPIHEYNPCHNPGGPGGGQFCSTGSPVLYPRTGLGMYPYAAGSKKIPGYLKMDVLRARQAGVEVYHAQQPEPVRDITGKIHDPLALSHARRGETSFIDPQGMRQTAPKGRIFLTTRGGEFEPTEEVWYNGFPRGRQKKELTPDMLTDPATAEDIVSTFRHELGHIMDSNWSGSRSGTVPQALAREIRAWTYAVEISPDHAVSAKMVRSGLGSHAYNEFRKQAIEAEFGRRLDDAALNIRVSEESKRGFIDQGAFQKAHAFTERVVKSLTRYAEVLKKKGLVRAPEPYGEGHIWAKYRKILPGPGGRGLL